MNFIARSAKRFQQQAIEILQANPTPSTARPLPIFYFPEDCDKWIVGTDVDYKPSSTSTASFTSCKDNSSGTEISFARFSGRTAADGYAATRSLVPPSSFYGTPTFDVSPYRYLALRVRSRDTRRYFINLQSDSYLSTDLYQHRLFLQRTDSASETLFSDAEVAGDPVESTTTSGNKTDTAQATSDGVWEDVMLPWDDFTLTNNGQIQEHQIEMDKYRLKTVGISVLDRLPGPFQLDIMWIRAENEPKDGAASQEEDEYY